MSVGCNDKFYETRAIFDTGITRTYITEELAKVLKVKSVEQETSVYSFGSTKAKEKTSPVVDLAIKIKAGKTITIKATVTPQITGPLKRVPIQIENQRKIQKDYPLTDTLPKDIETYTLGLLIGNDYYNDIILDKRKKIQDNLYAINSKLGWIISGKVSSTNDNEKENVMFAIAPASSCLLANIHPMTMERGSTLFEPNTEELWNLETIGIKSKRQFSNAKV